MEVLGRSVARLSLLEKLVRSAGWSPIGKAVTLAIDESLHRPDLGRRLTGVLSEYAVVETSRVSNAQRATFAECALISLDTEVQLEGIRLQRLFAVPRHAGYGFHSLPWARSIAVYVTATQAERIPDSLKAQDIIGIWSLKLR